MTRESIQNIYSCIQNREKETCQEFPDSSNQIPGKNTNGVLKDSVVTLNLNLKTLNLKHKNEKKTIYNSGANWLLLI